MQCLPQGGLPGADGSQDLIAWQSATPDTGVDCRGAGARTPQTLGDANAAPATSPDHRNVQGERHRGKPVWHVDLEHHAQARHSALVHQLPDPNKGIRREPGQAAAAVRSEDARVVGVEEEDRIHRRNELPVLGLAPESVS